MRWLSHPPGFPSDGADLIRDGHTLASIRKGRMGWYWFVTGDNVIVHGTEICASEDEAKDKARAWVEGKVKHGC